MRWYDEDMWSKMVIGVIVALLAVVLFAGCKTKYVPAEKVVYQNVTKYDTLHTADSVWLHDSVWVWQKGDTLIKDRWHERVVRKLVYKTKTDSFIRRDSVPVPYPVEKKLSRWEQAKMSWMTFWVGIVCGLMVALFFIIYKKTKYEQNQRRDK